MGLLSSVLSKRNRNLAMVAGGMLGLPIGHKWSALSSFAKGIWGLEEEWRRNHPEFRGSLADRWQLAVEFYDQTHQNKVNRALHIIGIPMILGGAVGMLAMPRFTPPWFLANGSYTAGWILNLIGHGVYEKGAPAFADDPLAFVAGPVWDFVKLKDLAFGGRASGAPVYRDADVATAAP